MPLDQITAYVALDGSLHHSKFYAKEASIRSVFRRYSGDYGSVDYNKVAYDWDKIVKEINDLT